MSTAEPPRSETVPAAYDFRTPRALSRENTRTLSVAFEAFARHWSSQLTTRLGAACTVRSTGVAVLRYDDYVSGLPAHTAMFLAATAVIESRAVMQVPTELGLGWIHRMLGGSAEASVPQREYTALEFSVLRHVVDDAFQDIAYSLGDLLVTELRVSGVHYAPQLAQAAGTAERFVCATFTVDLDGRLHAVSVALPGELVLPRLGADAPAVDAAASRTALVTQMATVPVDVAVRLAPLAVLPAAVLDLAVGDLIRLPHSQHRPLTLVVDGEPVADAAVGTSGSRLACLVVSVKEEERE